MDRRMPIAGVLVSIGVASLVAGVTNLATDVTQVDHDYGYGLVAFGAVALITGAIWYFVLSSHSDGDLNTVARAERASVSVVGDKNITINMPQLGGTTDVTEKVKPNIVFDDFSPVRDQPIAAPRLNQPTRAEFARLQFVNEPETPDSEANISDLHAVIEVWDISGKELLLRVPDGRWAENVDGGTAPARDTKSVPIPGTGETRTLDIAMRPYGDNNCYGWDHNGFKISEPPIPTGTYQVHVELDGSNMEKRHFRFILDNPLGADKNGVIEDSWIDLREAGGFTNPCSAHWASRRDKQAAAAEKERIRRRISAIDPLIVEAQEILEACGRPSEQMGGADPMHFQTVCIPRINQFARDATATIQGVAPEYMGKFQNVGNVTHGTDVKPAMIQQVERWLENLGSIQDELRKRL